MKYRYAFLLLPLLFAMCRTTPETIPEGLDPKELFQRAQEAVVERNDYETALSYYRTFLERYPDDVQRVVEAEYEIAFIHYKLGEYETARRQLNELIARYESDQSQILPQWPLILSRKVLEKIDEKTAAESEG